MTDPTIDDVQDTGDHATAGAGTPDPTPQPVQPGSEDDVPADPTAVPHDLREPRNTFAAVVFHAATGRGVLLDWLDDEEWADVDDDQKTAFAEMAMAAIGAYDRYLQGKADRYADAVAGIPSFAEQLAAAIEADDAAKRAQS